MIFEYQFTVRFLKPITFYCIEMKGSNFKPYVFVLDVLKEDIHDQKGHNISERKHFKRQGFILVVRLMCTYEAPRPVWRPL